MQKYIGRKFINALAVCLIGSVLLGAIAFTRGFAKTLAAPLLFTGAQGPGLTKQTWPAGTFLSHIDRGGRLITFHRGFAYFQAESDSSLWDISDPVNPVKLQDIDKGDNGHRWWKFQDMFWREYSTPEIAGTGFKFMDLSNMLNRVPWTKAAPMPIQETGFEHFQSAETFPITLDGNNYYDNRTQLFYGIYNFNQGGIQQTLRFRIGNLMFFYGGGLSVFDIGDPAHPKFISSFLCACQQYTTTYQIWRNYAIFMSGDNSNMGGNNLVALDFSDPTNIKFGFGVPFVNSPGRYMLFQDKYGFTGSQQSGVKLNLETQQVVQRFQSPDPAVALSDFQWAPWGHILVASGAESGVGQTFIYSQQDTLDTNPPVMSYHQPVDKQTNLPVTSVIGFVIDENLDDTTINDQTIQVSPLGGSPIAGDVMSTSYSVINFAPKQLLLPNTTYQVKLVGGGIKDVAGNGIVETSFTFTTAATTGGNQPPVISSVSYGSTAPVTVNTPLTFTASASDPESNALQYRWNFNDGSGFSAWSASNTAAHTFAAPGPQNVTVQVSDGINGVVAMGISLVSYEPVTGNAPTRSSSIIVDAARRKVWVVNPDADTVSVLNPDTNAKLAEIVVGANPTSVALDGSGQVWVTCSDGDIVYVLNAATNALVKTISLARGAHPYAVVFDPAGSNGYISEYGSGKITKVAAATSTVVGSLAIGPTPRGLAISGDGATLYVTRFISPDAGGSVWGISLSTFALASTISLPTDTTSADSGSNGRGLPNYVAGLAIDPTGKKAWVTAKKDNIFRGLARDGRPLTFESTVRGIVSQLDLGLKQEVIASRVDIDNASLPSAAVFSPLGTHVFVTTTGDNRLIVIDPSTHREIARPDVGLAPEGLAIDPTTKHIFIQNFTSRDVTIFDASAMLNSGSPTLILLATVKTVTTEKLSAQQLLGEQIFYNARDLRMSLDNYISCASCHIDGDNDGRTWDFTDRGEGLRNTIALKGRAGMSQGRVHWSANFDEIQDFENDIRGPFAGKGFMSDTAFNSGTTSQPLGDPKAGKSSDLDALAAYVATFNTFDPSPFRNPDGTLTSDGVAGRALFQSQGCANCHTGAGFTDSASGLMHDVGTIKSTSGKRLNAPLLGLDAPTLRDAWRTAPYLHNGSAATLLDVLTTQNTGGAHGATAGLNATQLSQLVAFLQQIDGSEPAFTGGVSLAVTSPVNGATFGNGAITLSVSTNLTNVTQVVYYVNGSAVAQSSTAPFSASWTPATSGVDHLQAKAFHDGGNMATLSTEVTFTVASSAPTVTSTATSGPSLTPTKTPPPPTNTPVSGGPLNIQFNKGNGQDNNQQTGFNVLVKNTGASAISNISFRVYFTADSSNAGSAYTLDKYYDQSAVATVSAPALACGNIYYAMVSYGTASLAAGTQWEYQSALRLSSWGSTYDGSNDWFHSGYVIGALPINYTNAPLIPGYLNGTLAWGSAPSCGATPLPTNTGTLVAPTATRTITPMVPTATPTNTLTVTPVILTATRTPTQTVGASNTPIGPTATRTATLSPTPIVPTLTRTNTPLPPTVTNTPVPPTITLTRTNTPVGPTATRTFTPVSPTMTRTNTPMPPTVTPGGSDPCASPTVITGAGSFAVSTSATCFKYVNTTFKLGGMWTVMNGSSTAANTLKWYGGRSETVTSCINDSQVLSGNGAQLNNFTIGKDSTGAMYLIITGSAANTASISIQNWQNGTGCSVAPTPHP